MKTYRKHMVMMICGLAERADFLTDGKYDFGAMLPAHPEMYDKDDWEQANYSIEHITLNNFLVELDEAIEDCKAYQHTKLDQLNNIKDILTDIDWSEV